MSTTQVAAKRGQNAKFSKTEQALVDQANAKAAKRDPKGFAAVTAAISAKDAAKAVAKAPAVRAAAKAKAEAHIAATKAVTKVPTKPANGATDKAPHTKRAVQQNAQAQKLEKAEQRVVTAKAEFARLEKVADKTDVKEHRAGKTTPARLAAFKAKAVAGDELIAAQKALAALKRDQMSPEERAAKAKPAKEPKTERQPRVTEAKKYKVVNRDHGTKPDSKRAKQLEIVFKHTDTAAAKAAGAEAVDLSFAIAKGFIKYL